MDRQALEDAIHDLDVLLEEDPPEDEFQKWFERHPVVFTVLNYGRVIPHPIQDAATRKDTGTRKHIPDFMAQKVDGLWEIIELKRAGAKVLKDRESRNTFYAEMETCIAQCEVRHLTYDDVRAHLEQQRSRPKSLASVTRCVLLSVRRGCVLCICSARSAG